MAWYNAGDWTGLDGTNIQNAIAALCNAVNERWDALGLARVSWTTNSGAKSTNLAASDFTGLDLHRTNYYQQILDNVEVMVDIGFAKTSTNTAKGADLWTMATLATDIGIDEPSTITSIFDKTTADFLRQALDRLIYPVVLPTNDIGNIDNDPGPAPRTYWEKGVADNSASAAWSDLGGSNSRNNALRPNVIVRAQWDGNDWPVVYTALTMLRIILQVAPRNVGLAGITPYHGAITKAWLALRYETYSLSGAIGGTFFGVADSVSNTGTDIFLRDLDVATSNFSTDGFTNPVMHLDSIPATNPFDGSRILFGPGGERTSAGEGEMIVGAVFRREQDGVTVNTVTADYYTRFILDISGELTDQA